MSAAEVIILQNGRSGSLSYREGENEAVFEWEFGGSVIAVIWGTKKNEWNKRYPWAAGRQPEIFNFVAKEAIRQKASQSNFEIDLNDGTITILRLLPSCRQYTQQGADRIGL